MTSEFQVKAGLADYVYLSPNHLSSGPQTYAETGIPKHEQGYCYTYTLMYLHMRLTHLDWIPAEIVNALISQPPSTLRQAAVKYNFILRHIYGWNP